MEVLRTKVLIGVLLLYLLEECQASHNSFLSSTPTTSNHSNKGSIQPSLERKHMFNNHVIPVYEVNVPWRITIANPSTSRKPFSRPIAQKSLPSSPNALPKTQAQKEIKDANKNRYRRSPVRNPKFDAVFDLKRQYETFQQKFLRASDCAKKTWGKRITNKLAAWPQVEKTGNRDNMEERKGEFPFKKLRLPKFAISQFFKPSFSYAGPIESLANSVVSSSSVDFILPVTTLVDALSALKVPLSRKTFKFHSENSHPLQGALTFLDTTSKLPWNRVQISPWSYQYVLEPSKTDSNSSLSTIPKVKDQSFWKANSPPSLQWTQNILNSANNLSDFSFPKYHMRHHFQYSLEAPKSHENNSKVSELVPVKSNVSSGRLPKIQSQMEFASRITTSKPTWNIQSVLEPAGSQKISSNGSELNVLKSQNFSSLRLPNSQVEYFFKITSVPPRSLLKPSEIHKNYSGFSALILPKPNKLSLFQPKPAISSVAEVLNITTSPIDAQHFQPNSLKSSPKNTKNAHGSPKLSELAINVEVSNSTMPLLPKGGNSKQFNSAVPSSGYSSGLSLPRSHGNFSSKVVSKFNASQRTLSTPKLSRHHQFVVEPSSIPLVPLNISQISGPKSKAGTFLKGLSASISSSQSHNAVKSPKNQEIRSDAPKVFVSSTEANRNHFEFSELRVPKANIVRQFKPNSEPSFSPGNTNKLWSRSEFQSINPSNTESSPKPSEIISNSAKRSLPHNLIINQKDPERITRDSLLPQVLEDPTQFVNPNLTLRSTASKNLSQSSSPERTLPLSAAPSTRSSIIEQSSSTHKIPLSSLSKALQENIWYTSQFVPRVPESSSKLEHETTALKMLIVQPEVNAPSRVPLPNITKYHSFQAKKEAPTIISHTESERKEIGMKFELEREHIETAGNGNLAVSIPKNTNTTSSYMLPIFATGVKFREPSTLVQNETLTLDQPGSALLSSTNPISKPIIPNVRSTHSFRKVSELSKTEQKPQRDTTSKPVNSVVSQVRYQILASSSESSTAAAKIDSQRPQQISVASIRKQNDNRLDKRSDATLTHMKHVKRRRIRPGTRTRTVLQNQNDQPSNLTKLRLLKGRGEVKFGRNLSSERLMNSTKSRGVIRRPMPSALSHLVPNTNESSLDFKAISESHRSDIPVELGEFPVNSKKSSGGELLSSSGSSEVLQKGGSTVNTSLERVTSKKNLVVTLFKEKKLSQNVPENAVLADVEVS